MTIYIDMFANRFAVSLARDQTKRSIPEKISQPKVMQAGMVTTQAVTMRPAIPQRTADALLVAPTPRMAEEITCVVDTGMPSRLANSMIDAAAVSAAKPS